MRRASRVVSSIMAATRRYGVPGAVWELCAPNRRIARAGNHYFISLERRVLWNIDLQVGILSYGIFCWVKSDCFEVNKVYLIVLVVNSGGVLVFLTCKCGR